MFDLEVHMTNRPGEISKLGEVLGQAGISIEGGGVFSAGTLSVAHFLVEDGDLASRRLASAGFDVARCKPVVVTRVDQERPGQLGAICRAFALDGINIDVLYSDHDGNLILVVDEFAKGQAVADRWAHGG